MDRKINHVTSSLCNLNAVLDNEKNYDDDDDDTNSQLVAGGLYNCGHMYTRAGE